MEVKLLLEGAVAGHMNHIYDNGEMTFGELKQLIQAIVDGKIRGTEKTDGQNIFLSYDVQRGVAVAARNKGHLKKGGLTVEELDDFFSDHPAQGLRYSFTEALQVFEDSMSSLDRESLEKIFGSDSEVYFNTEVMNPGNPDVPEGDPRGADTTNVIPYDKKTLLIHRVGHSAFDKETGKSIDRDVSQNFAELESKLMGKGTDDPTVFSVETNQVRRLPPFENEEAAKLTIETIDDLSKDMGLNDESTINDYVIKQVEPEIESFGLTEDVNLMILKRVMNLPDKQNLRQITSGMPLELKDEISTFVKNFKYSSYTTRLQHVLHDFSVAAVDGLKSAFISDNEKQINFLQSQVQQSIAKIENSSNERAKEELARQMKKLKTSKGINTPSEGFVFNWNGITYKLTGNFAPTNQILGMERFQRFGPIEPLEKEETPAEGDSQPLTIAIVPGAFKPPHKGHLSMVESLAQESDKVIIIISTPTKSGRTLPSGKAIDSNHAEQIWRSYLDHSPAGQKTVVIKSPAASPVGVTYDFVMKQPNPTDQLIAPAGARVLLGCGDKEDDKTRYQGIIDKAREDLEIKVQVCNLTAKHSPEYLQLLQKHPMVAQGLPSRRKTSVSIEDLHASDMRYIIDIASREPVGLSLLNDFVPQAEDALAVLGILGLNPADQRDPESDQVEEEEIDDPIQEVISKLYSDIFEKRKPRKTPAGRPSSDEYQVSMRKRLKKSHNYYLTTGGGPRGKVGTPFSNAPVIGNSNAFLAENELEELVSVVSGALTGAAISKTPKRKQKTLPRKKTNYKREEKTMPKMTAKQERRLRFHVRKRIVEFFEIKKQENSKRVKKILEEHELRKVLREIILQESIDDNAVMTILEQENPATDWSDSTGINTLKDLLKNTNVLATLRGVYKSLTTNEDQKRSFRSHIVKWIQDTLAPVKLNDRGIKDPESDPESAIAEQVGVDVQGVGADGDKFIEADDGSEKDQAAAPADEEEEKMKPISGEDTTGRNKAERVYPSIEKSIVDYYGELDNPEDQEMFYDYLIANIKLYFDKWDNESSFTPPEEPTNDAYQQAKDIESSPGLSAV